MHRKGRAASFRGEHHKLAKLTADDVREMRRRYAPGKITMQALADEYGVSLGRVHEIIKRGGWPHVT